MKRAVILLTLAAAALAGPVAVAIATAHRVHPTVSVLSEKVRGTSVGFTLDVSFKVPRGAKPGSACKGKVGVSVKKSHWSGRLAASKGLCDARVKGKLPKAAEGTKVRFKVAFAGNSVVSPFSSSKPLKLSNPPTTGLPPGPTPTPAPSPTPAPGPGGPGGPGPVVGPPTFADGHWQSVSGPPLTFSVVQGIVKNAGITSNSFIVHCVDGSMQPADLFYLWSYRNVALESGGHFSDAYEKVLSDNGNGTSYDLNLTFSGDLGESGTGDITGAVTGGNFTFLNPPPGSTLSGCHNTFTAHVVKTS